ncbi:MAG: MarR family transcriptional regulator [Porticoccaceae bacterium]|nr:MarR family transcriptional regulator [Porticoccaceae bacterium]
MTESNVESRELSQKVYFRLYQTINVALRAVAALLSEVDMSPQQWSILDSLSRPGLKEGMTVNGLVEYLMVSRQSLNGVLKRMEKAGYIERVVNPDDQRSRKIRLSDHGREIWTTADDRTRRFYIDSLEHMNEQNMLDAIATLEKMQINIRSL